MPTTTNIITKRYYPALSEVITIDDLPEFLHFAEDGLNVLLDKVHYKNLQYSKSYHGDAAFYSLDIVTKNIGFDLPFGLRFILNPDVDGDSTISSFPVSLQYQWEVLAFLKNFNVQNFSFSPQGFYELGLKIFKISEEQVIAQILNYFIDDSAATASKFQLLIDEINSLYPAAALTLPADQEPTVEQVSTMISQNVNIPETISELMFVAYILNTDTAKQKDNLQQFYALMVPDGIEDYIKKMLEPKLKATLQLSAGIEFPLNILKPVTANGTLIPNTKTVFKFAEATFYVDTESGIGSDVELAGSLTPEFSQIGNTGLIIGFTGAKLDLSRTTNIPEADAAGYPVDFTGLYVKHATIGFNNFGKDNPDKVSAKVTADNLFIGTGGVSGKIALESNGLLHRDFGNFAVALNTFALTFRQNAIINTDIKGQLTLGGFKAGSDAAVINIEAHIHDNGDFSIAAAPATEPWKITLPGVLEIDIRSLELGKEERGFYAEVAGQLTFIANLPVLGDVLPKGIEIKQLRIWDNGDLEFKGGGLVVPKSFSLKVGPVKLEVTNIGIGSYTRKLHEVERSYRYFAFDGMINTGRAGVQASGNGIKFYYTVDNNDSDKHLDTFVSIDGITIDISVPGNVSRDDAAFLLHGHLSMANPDPAISGSTAGSEYTGAVTFSLPKLKLAGSASMRLQPQIPAFVVDIGMEMATPIPLGATGLGIYGFRGLIGEHYLPSKSATHPALPDSASWWDYYKAKSTLTQKEGIEIDKFAEKSGYSVGAGLSIATSFDSGKVFSSKLFLLLGLPDVFLLQGQAGILRSRIGLNDKADPPFSAFIAIDSSSFRGNLGVNYNLPEDDSFKGKIFSLTGTLDMAFFFNNASGWYLNVGKDQPESARVKAEILTLFKGYAYLMISSRGFKAGAGAKFDFNKHFGPVGVGIGASLDMSGSVSFRPVQIGAMIQFGGYAYIKVLFIKLGLSVQVSLAVEAPHPFNIVGGLEIQIKIPFKKIRFRLEVSWRINSDNSVLLQPLPVLELPDPAKGYMPAAAVNILSNESFQLNYINQEIRGSIVIPAPGDGRWKYNFNDATDVMQVTIPLDSYIDIELLKPVKPGLAKLGGAGNQLPDGYFDLLPPQKGMGNQVRHEYQLTGLEIYAWHDTGTGTGSWQPYNVYEAVTAIVTENAGAIDLSTLKEGYWQFAETNKYNKIRLLSQNMFSYVNQSTSDYSGLDALNFQRKDLFCFENVSKESVVNWTAQPVDTTYTSGSTNSIEGVSFTFNGTGGTVKNEASFGSNSLQLDNSGGTMVISLPKPVTTLSLDFGDNKNDVQVDFISKISLPGVFGRAHTLDQTLASSSLSKEQQQTTIGYNDINHPIDKVAVRLKSITKSDHLGDLVIGGYFELPEAYISGNLITTPHEDEVEKALLFAAMYSRAVTGVEVLSGTYQLDNGAAGRWPMDTTLDEFGSHPGILTGSPDRVAGFYEPYDGQEQLHTIYSFSGNSDGLVVPYAPDLNVESESFAFEVTAVFNPFTPGISTLLHKVKTDPLTGDKKGFALHLYQDTPADAGANYSTAGAVPSFSIWLTTYSGKEQSALKVSEKYTTYCDGGKVKENQYKHILVSINRNTGELEFFLDRRLKMVSGIPDELGVVVTEPAVTYVNQVSYLTEELQRRKEENEVSKDKLLEEVQLIGDSLNKTIQPVWRPDTTYAVAIKTRDVVDGKTSSAVEVTHIYGFKTAGPIGHFQQQSVAYQALLATDRAAEFKLANLKYYIDYERSFPDAQSRYELSKPVLYRNPKVSLFFIKPYINSMFANWDSYLGLPAINSRLQVQVLDPFGVPVSPELVWEQLPDREIDSTNFRSLPMDQQILFLMNLSAAEDSCNENPLVIRKRTKRGSYQLPDLQPNRLYTALFTAVYQPDGEAEQQSEVHRFSFKTSLFASFEEQARSFVLNDTPGNEQYAVYPLKVSFTEAEIDLNLKTLIDDNLENDPSAVLQYAVKFDRLVYAGLKLNNIVPPAGAVIDVVTNVNPENAEDKKILGILIRNPEAFNDPKIDALQLADTLKLTLTATQDNTVFNPDQFIYIHSRDTSSVFITNAAMDIPVGQMQLTFRHKLFNGNDYQTEYEEYVSPQIPIVINL